LSIEHFEDPVMGSRFSGLGTALITPFKKDGSVDEAAVKRLVRRQLDAGVNFVSPCGTTGEAPTLSRAEKLRVVELVVEEVNHKVPVLAGAGGYDTHELTEFVRDLERVGCDGLLSVTPYYNRPTQEGLFQHYREMAHCTALPIVLYNVPGRTGVNLEPRTVARLADERCGIVGIKEASGNVVQMIEIISMVPKDFVLVSGDDPLAVAVMGIGGRGLISVASNAAPAEMTQIIDLCRKGDFAAARKLHTWLLPFIQVNFVEANPIPIKAAMAAMGLIEEVYRLPLLAPSDSARSKIMHVLQDLKLAGAAARA
jgi:4-hydroxy-tetrahydrodipicolinate synthase